MKPKRRGPGYSRVMLLFVALLLPSISLIPFGGLWLWQKGYVVYWALASCLLIGAVYYLQARILADPTLAAAEPSPHAVGDPNWTPRQVTAWENVLAFGSKVQPERITSREAALGLGLETVEVVARQLHPERKDPLLEFTVPEALAVIERASGGLRDFVATTFPLGDRITVAQFMWMYRWRGAVQLVEKGYDLWRVVRLLNPISAATQELRERYTRHLYDVGRDHVARRLARAYVREVGRAAIDLYGGNLRVTAKQMDRHVTVRSQREMEEGEAREAEPMRVLLAGQTGAGKSSVVNALASAVKAEVNVVPATTRFTAYKITHHGLPAAVMVDSPGLTSTTSTDALVESAAQADMILWVASATRAAREVDRQALTAVRNYFIADTNRRQPPIVLVLTHIDGLRPFQEWSPPYDLNAASGPKAQSIVAAMEAAGDELGFAADEMVPVRADSSAATYNIDALWGKIIELVPEAQRARLLRVLSDIKDASSWAVIWSQAANAGRVIKGTFLSRDPGS